ncbi:hypothetical protein [Roseovarius atlanticus]|uniref:hypothetical protein n=1 Tax=Roseovarius atlanticus TaxID=1641875 RepID=UPI001C9581ED|nr:hypothetical protein [Roseovarius atlanticus]MBY5988225.1 hypothetical protein [Roseovarius atlanticus]MBY6123616.1 hypothetical protein [Roseovarius atlanticus]MBY6148111.1 hypothetical protein [Roseovarius atlanticus]
MIIRYALIAALVACLGLGGALWWQSDRVAGLEADKARLERSVQSLEAARAQARTAARVAQAEAERQRALAIEYEQVKDAFREGDFDAPLPDDFRDLLDRILRSGD